ncbi:uncharacterized protein LOC143691066 isoform X2 [Tamandua tetradactyla]
MVFGLCCQTERFCKSLYAIHIFMLAAFLHLPVEVVYYYFQGSMQKTGPDYEIAGEPSQQCKTRCEKKQASEALTPRVHRGLNDAAHKKKADPVPQEEGQVRVTGEEAANPFLLGRKWLR